MPSLLSQPDPIIEKIQSYLGPRSASRIESTHPELQKAVSKSNRYWKDSFVREAEKGNHVLQDRSSPHLLALKRAHPNSQPKGYWKDRYRKEIHPVLKAKHDQKVVREVYRRETYRRIAYLERRQNIRYYLNLTKDLTLSALVPSALTAASGAIVFSCSAVAASCAASIQIMSQGISSPITTPIMGLSVRGLVGGCTAMAVGLGSAPAIIIPIAIGIYLVAELSDWKANRERAQREESRAQRWAQREESFVEES